MSAPITGMFARANSGHVRLFDHFVGYLLNLPRNCEAKSLRGLEIDH
jgi:hypothetical protein